MNKVMKNWYYISVYLGAICALIAVLGNGDLFTQEEVWRGKRYIIKQIPGLK